MTTKGKGTGGLFDADKADKFGEQATGEKKALHPNQCTTCALWKPKGWRGNFRHCTGSQVAWCADRYTEPHHGHVVYRPCWHCHQPLGCDQCAGRPEELLCTRCAVWGTRAALVKHGPIENAPSLVRLRRGLVAPQLSAYPADFQTRYRNTSNLVEEPRNWQGAGAFLAELAATSRKAHGGDPWTVYLEEAAQRCVERSQRGGKA